jgi:hypothetical protein
VFPEIQTRLFSPDILESIGCTAAGAARPHPCNIVAARTLDAHPFQVILKISVEPGIPTIAHTKQSTSAHLRTRHLVKVCLEVVLVSTGETKYEQRNNLASNFEIHMIIITKKARA